MVVLFTTLIWLFQVLFKFQIACCIKGSSFLNKFILSVITNTDSNAEYQIQQLVKNIIRYILICVIIILLYVCFEYTHVNTCIIYYYLYIYCQKIPSDTKNILSLSSSTNK